MAQQKRKKLKIRVFGVVQGVGFRPYVARLAERHQVAGCVKNCGGYVEILAMSQGDTLRLFLHDLLHFPNVLHIQKDEITDEIQEGFRIEKSESGNHSTVMLPPDLPVCERCLSEMRDPKNRRFRHAFISCVDCGVRYSMIENIPYDRETTAMQDFSMCEACEKEYTTLLDVRHHAQTISCKNCGPELLFGNKTGEDALSAAIEILKMGGIIAIKGVGGYHLATSPFEGDALKRLREMKQREEKPFAVMFRDVEEVQKYCEVTDEEKKLLIAAARPIVLLKRKASDIHPLVFQESDDLGAFLPYTPYQHLLLEELRALVLTSANISNKPMITEDEEAHGIPCDGVLYHKRRIVVPLDDSVVCSEFPIRRARGFVPLPLYVPSEAGMAFAAGGDLKAVFALKNSDYYYPSQYFGDLEELQNMNRWSLGIRHMKKLFRISPQYAVCDLHPGYYSAKACETLAIPVYKIQHHYAHTLSVMAEHQMEEVIGISFDGTGFGCDGTIWGGEFLLCNRRDFIRCGHLEPFEMLGGDSAAKDARKTAVCAQLSFGFEENYFKDARFATISAAIRRKINTVSTSSVGRLFDAVSASLGILALNHYEGACGEALMRAANHASEGISLGLPLDVQGDGFILKQRSLWDQILAGGDAGALALGFHTALASACRDGAVWIRDRYHINTVALSGGVFQNRLLLSLASTKLREAGFEVYINQKVPPNDSGLAIGQLYWKSEV